MICALYLQCVLYTQVLHSQTNIVVACPVHLHPAGEKAALQRSAALLKKPDAPFTIGFNTPENLQQQYHKMRYFAIHVYAKNKQKVQCLHASVPGDSWCT